MANKVKILAPRKAIVIDSKDNVATALVELPKTEVVVVEIGDDKLDIMLLENIFAGHKFALRDLKIGGPVIKYGETIGLATANILPGQLVHVHNVEGTRGRGDKQ